MEKRVGRGWLFAAAAIVAWAMSAQEVRAAETVGICVNNVKGSDAHFTVDYKDGDAAMKDDSGEYDSGRERCIEVPTNATDITLTVYKSRFILWGQACTKSWPTAPEQPAHVNVSGSTFGVACEGI
jgi:hypothetical protein